MLNYLVSGTPQLPYTSICGIRTSILHVCMHARVSWNTCIRRFARIRCEYRHTECARACTKLVHTPVDRKCHMHSQRYICYIYIYVHFIYIYIYIYIYYLYSWSIRCTYLDFVVHSGSHISYRLMLWRCKGLYDVIFWRDKCLYHAIGAFIMCLYHEAFTIWWMPEDYRFILCMHK